MALNWTMLGPNKAPVPLPNEMTITTIESGAEIILRIPDAPPSAGAVAGGSGGSRTLKATGKVTVTDQRFIFTSSSDPAFESLSVPLPSILSTKFEQPTFGANYFTFDIRPAADGGLTNGTTAEVRFKDQAMFQFVATLEKTRERAIYMKRQEVENEEGPPVYTTPAEGSSTSSAGVNTVPVDNPPGYEV
ncbi:hypothetical protein B0H16DRAFT_1589849 [Mycena metata]|uniref:GRAM domain-containing protein n=1 Tax=Mycena metata TaxID=1033252 RepID=A0AAD7HTP0_9AGAR|nr:hypothetical protein B0H16DRAFT_1595146 [Mycena metata]KAJ7727951.1 hypothetical protein B0H16DRAFT_1589849 [Mycena metata]